MRSITASELANAGVGCGDSSGDGGVGDAGGGGGGSGGGDGGVSSTMKCRAMALVKKPTAMITASIARRWRYDRMVSQPTGRVYPPWKPPYGTLCCSRVRAMAAGFAD